MTILLSGNAEQKFELFFLMYHNIDPRRVGSGARLDRQAGTKGQKHAAASQYCVYLMMAALKKHLIAPALELTGAMASVWISRAKEEENQFVEDMRISGHQTLTFDQLWSELVRPVRHRSWLLELIGLDQIEIAEAGFVNASRWHALLNTNSNSLSAGVDQGKFGLHAGMEAVVGGMRLNMMGKLRASEQQGGGKQIPQGSVWVKGKAGAGAGSTRRAGGARNCNSGDRPRSGGGRRRRKNTMSFRRNASSQARFHRGSSSVEAANREDAALRGGRTVATASSAATVADTHEDLGGSAVAVPLYAVALRAAAKAKHEIEHGVVWEYDSTVAKQPAPVKSIRWKRFDPVTELSIETGFQANTDHITLSSTTWPLGDEFVRHEGDGAASLSFAPETGTYGRETWHGMTLSNRRSGRVKRVRRYYRIDEMAILTTPRLQELETNMAITNTVDAAGCMHRDELFKSLTAHELAAPRRRRRALKEGGLAASQNAGQQSQDDQEHVKALQAAAAKECYSLVYQESNASTGVTNVMSVLKRLRQKARTEDEAKGISWAQRMDGHIEEPEPELDPEEETKLRVKAREEAAALAASLGPAAYARTR